MGWPSLRDRSCQSGDCSGYRIWDYLLLDVGIKNDSRDYGTQCQLWLSSVPIRKLMNGLVCRKDLGDVYALQDQRVRADLLD